MTFQPPPPPPPPGGPPPPPGGQPPGQWGPPPGGNPPNPYGAPGAPRSGFDPKSVNPLDWAILAIGFLILIFSFTGYYKYSDKHCGSSCISFTNSAWHGFFGWFGVLLIVIGASAVAVDIFAPQIKLPAPARLIGLGTWAVGTVCIILTLFIFPGSASYAGFHGSTSGANKGHGFAFWLILLLAIGGLVVSVMRFQQKGGQLPGALNKMPNIGGHGPGGNPPPPPGYGPPPGGGPGYGPPPGQ